MSEREQAVQIVNALPDYQIAALLAFLRAFGEIPNAETPETDEERVEIARALS